MKKLSIIVPVYNEEKTLAHVLDALIGLELSGLEKEIIVVDDGSTDGTSRIIQRFSKACIHIRKENGGKGTAVKAGLLRASGDIAIIQDADLEYDPREYGKILKPILDGEADMVFGSRFGGGESRRVLYFWHSVGNKALTTLSNIFTNLNLTDMETCYKAFNKKAYNEMAPLITSERFGIEPELTSLASKLGLRIYEVGISYKGRKYMEGKKIGWKDGVAAVWHIVKFNMFDRR
jgi:glycosyltransferase involved in cell wall biosynthesis